MIKCMYVCTNLTGSTQFMSGLRNLSAFNLIMFCDSVKIMIAVSYQL